MSFVPQSTVKRGPMAMSDGGGGHMNKPPAVISTDGLEEIINTLLSPICPRFTVRHLPVFCLVAVRCSSVVQWQRLWWLRLSACGAWISGWRPERERGEREAKADSLVVVAAKPVCYGKPLLLFAAESRRERGKMCGETDGGV